MQPTNLTVNSSFVLAKCIDLVTSLANYTGNASEISFRSSGIEFIHVGGYKHVPILVNQNLFKFLQSLWTAGTIILLLCLSVIVLSWLNNFCKWFCPIEPQLPYCTEPDPEQLTPITRRLNRAVELANLNCYKATIPFIDTYHHKPVLTKDNRFLIKTFFQKNISPSGIYLEITPRVHCPNINCLPEHCTSEHVFHIWIPSSERTVTVDQPRLILPTVVTPVPLTSLIKHA